MHDGRELSPRTREGRPIGYGCQHRFRKRTEKGGTEKGTENVFIGTRRRSMVRSVHSSFVSSCASSSFSSHFSALSRRRGLGCVSAMARMGSIARSSPISARAPAAARTVRRSGSLSGELLVSLLETVEHYAGGSARCMMAENFLPERAKVDR